MKCTDSLVTFDTKLPLALPKTSLALFMGLVLSGQTIAQQEIEQNAPGSALERMEKISVVGKQLDQGTPTRLPLTVREIPQSISEVSRALMDAANMLDINDVMMNIPGVNVTLYDSQRPLYFARGFQITDFQVDGIPTYSGSTNQEYDTALYERIEVIRGANGLFSGVGSPSATVNLLRKRPGNAFSASVSATAGSWDMRRGVADVSSPFDSEGQIRGRLVLAHQNSDSFRDRYSEDKTAYLAIIEGDLGDNTTAAIGYQRQDNNPQGTIWGTIPIHAADGSEANMPVSTSFAPNWTHWQRESSTLFADLQHSFNTDWQAKVSVQKTDGDVSSLRVYASGFPDKNTGQGMLLRAGIGAGDDSRTSVDLYLTGSYQAFGLEHDLILGATWSELESTTLGFTSLSGWTYQVPDAWHYDGQAPMPEYSRTGAYRIATTKQQGLYIANRFRLADDLSLIGGARLSSWRTGTDNFDTEGSYAATTGQYKVSKEVTPYVGLVYDLNEDHALYASYTDIFTPQNYKDKNNNLLAPVLGSNVELGIKSELLDGQLSATVAIFKTRQDNYAVRDESQPDNSLPDGSSAYRGVNGTESRGLEMSVSGHINQDWLVNAGYTYVDTKRHNNDKIWTNLPEHSAQLSTHYDLGDWVNGLTLGGGFNWQGETIGYGVTHPQQADGVTYKQSPYVLANLYVNWQFTDKLSSTFSVTNLFDKVYWANIDYANYGKPRQVSLSLTWQY
ncbi:TonB-dependent siderophore receptor [Bowmanella denitrificans]|uniref:TonB-dependent siderophore receptor n=1 Tax=Bowmanella denitrificans TaxID=366582 RepID=UPI001C0ED0EC|nr:TonB-dependent siderophore receptor [Bowmanella denitrificans]